MNEATERFNDLEGITVDKNEFRPGENLLQHEDPCNVAGVFTDEPTAPGIEHGLCNKLPVSLLPGMKTGGFSIRTALIRRFQTNFSQKPKMSNTPAKSTVRDILR